MKQGMKNTILTILLFPLWRLDTFLFNTFGWVSPLREGVWQRRAKRLQAELNRQHFIRDTYGEGYTTLQALERYEARLSKRKIQ